MSFKYQKLDDGTFEIIMQSGTHWKNWPRRFALCTHENDASTIVEVLNEAEKNGTLKEK